MGRGPEDRRDGDDTVDPPGGLLTGILLATQLRVASDALVGLLVDLDPARWSIVPDASTWSIGKDAEHVAEAAGYHQWIVRRTIGHRVRAQRPRIERTHLTTALTVAEAIGRIRVATEEGAVLIASLGPGELALPTRPARAGGETLSVTIARVLIGHYGTHCRDVEGKLSGLGRVGARGTLRHLPDEGPATPTESRRRNSGTHSSGCSITPTWSTPGSTTPTRPMRVRRTAGRAVIRSGTPDDRQGRAGVS